MTPKSHPIKSSIVFVATALLLGVATGAAHAATVMTSTTGNVTANGIKVEQSAALNNYDEVKVEGNGLASLIVGDSAIVKMCHGAAMGFGSDLGSGPTALNLRTGHLKVSAGKRPTDSPLEIHTPAAIATLLGTEVHVVVDPASGDTTITSISHDIRVTGVSSEDKEGVVISEGQRVTIRKGGEPGAVETVAVAERTINSDCLSDARFRIAAVDTARRSYAADSVAQIASMDVEEGLPTVAAGPSLIPTGALGPPTFLPACLSFVQCAGVATGMVPGFAPSETVIVGPPGPLAPL